MAHNSNKRILVFISSFKPLIGGAEIALEEISRRLGHFDFDIVTPRHSPAYLEEEKLASNITIYRTGSKWSFPLTGFLKARELFKRYPYKVIHAYQASYAGLAAMRFKKKYPETKFILTIQEGKSLDDQSWLVKLLRARIIKSADHITAISSYLTEYVRRLNSEVKISLIPNGVDQEMFKRVDSHILSSQLGITSEDNVVITTSRLVEKNGIDRLIDAVSEIANDRTRKIKLVIVGRGPLEGQLRQQVKKLGSQGHIIFAGAVSYKEIPEYLSIADIFVRPSRSEGLGNSFLEAMSIGLPVIGTNVGGITDFITDNETGFIWRPEEGSLSKRILEVFDNEPLRVRVALNGQRLIFDNYGWDNIAKTFNQIYLSNLL